MLQKARGDRAALGARVRILGKGGVVLAALVLGKTDVMAQHHYSAMASNRAVRLYDNLGTHHYAVTTRHPVAQKYFNQGLRLTWAFNHPEAVRAFEEAERLDPTCAMCSWGVAYALGPNINAAMSAEAERKAHQAIQRAQARKKRVSARERALIDALAKRYHTVPGTDRSALDSAWARAVGDVVTRYPDDLEARVLHADALMNLSPWNYWDAGAKPRPATGLILSRVESVLKANADHPGACHLFIHAVEAADPVRALPCAERLAALMPGAGHLVHMPGHIYVRVGRYHDAIKANEHALHADGEMIEGLGVAKRGIYATGYYPHNFHFLSFAASMLGMSKTAIAAAEETTRRLQADADAMAPFMEVATAAQATTLVTFGRWDDILALPQPTKEMPFLTAMTWYAKGVAHAARGEPELAQQAVDRLRPLAVAHPAGDSRTTLSIAVLALEGEIALRCGEAAEAVKKFREAVRLEDGLTYNEPPTWYYPMRHSLGAALLANDQAVEAEQVYREDLARFPKNGWSLYGLARSLERLGKDGEAGTVWAEFARAWKHADVVLTASRY